MVSPPRQAKLYISGVRQGRGGARGGENFGRGGAPRPAAAETCSTLSDALQRRHYSAAERYRRQGSACALCALRAAVDRT